MEGWRGRGEGGGREGRRGGGEGREEEEEREGGGGGGDGGRKEEEEEEEEGRGGGGEKEGGKEDKEGVGCYMSMEVHVATYLLPHRCLPPPEYQPAKSLSTITLGSRTS